MAHWRTLPACHVSMLQFQQIPPVTRTLLIACVAVFCLEQFPQLQVDRLFALWPVQSSLFLPWQLVTYPFLHANASALFFNLLGLWMFGVELELLWGTRRYVQFLLASVLAAAACFALMSLLLGGFGVLAGLSSALFGQLLAFGMLFPRRPILLFFVMQTDMRTACIVFGVLQVVLVLASGGMGFVSNLAHLGGMLGAWLVILWWRHRPPPFKRKSPPVRRVK